jgi:hypothetical protein
MMDFSGAAGAATNFDLLPKGLLVWAILQVRGVKTGGSGSRYLDVELTIDQGQPFAGRKLFDKIGDPFFQGNSEKYRQMGMIAVTRILEAARNAGPHNPAGYQLADFTQLSGARVPIKVGIEEGTDGHEDKNRVAEWLTPNPQSQSGYKGFEKLSKGDHGLPQTQTQQPVNSGFSGAPATGGFGTTGGFGQGASAGATAGQPATTGFGNSNSGFQQPPADSSGQSGANGAGSATGQSATGFAGTGNAPMASPSSPESTPGWLAQAGTQAQG